MPSLASLVRDRPVVMAAWLIGLVFAMQFLLNDLLVALGDPRWRVGGGTMIGRDFANVFTAGNILLDGKLSLIYDLDAYRAYQKTLLDGAVQGHNYSYPPVSFFYTPFFALAPYGLSYLLWIGLTGLAFALAARPYLREAGLPAWAALLVPASLANIWAGHYGFVLGALWLGAWSLVESRPRLAGVLVGLMIVKPHLALLMPLALARRRAWTPFLYAGLAALTLVLVSGLVFGWSYWTTYLTYTSGVQAAMIDETGEFYLRMMSTVFPAAMLAGSGTTGAWIVQGLCAAAAIGALWKWMPADPKRAGLATATATFLVLPYAFNYDLTVVGIAALILLHEAGEQSPVRRFLAVLAFVMPMIVIHLNHGGMPIAPIAVAGLLAALLGTARQGQRRGSDLALAPA